MMVLTKNERGWRIELREVVTLADGQALLDEFSEVIDRLTQDELRATTTAWLRRFVRTYKTRAARRADAAMPKARNCGCRSRGVGTHEPGGDRATLRAFAARFAAADGAELGTVIREFGRWVESRGGVPA
jgi:hypothetical protein